MTTFEAPARHQRAVLRRLLELHRSVDLLQRHGVAVPPGLGSEPQPDAAAADAAALELLHRLPLTTYADYEQLVEEALAAACAVSPADPASKAAYDAALARLTGQTGVYAFWCTSGSMGKQKRLPASQAVTESNMEVGNGWLTKAAGSLPSAACLFAATLPPALAPCPLRPMHSSLRPLPPRSRA